MTQEEKAKAYDEALKVLHKYDGINIMFTQELKEEMFPELVESGDKRIRKELINYFTEITNNICAEETIKHEEKLFGGKCRKWIAWLEKQKPVEWDKKDEVIKEDAVFFINEYRKSNMCKNGCDFQNAVTCEDWLKSLQPQKRHVYITEEELSIAKKDAYNEALDKIEYGNDEPTFDNGWSAALLFLKRKGIYE